MSDIDSDPTETEKDDQEATHESVTKWWTSHFDGPPVFAFETGTPFYLKAGLALSFAAPKLGEAAFGKCVADPAKPMPFIARHIPRRGLSS